MSDYTGPMETGAEESARMTENAPIRQDIAKCKSCKEPIIFVKTAATGKFIPLNAKPERRMIINTDQKAESVTTWTPHHATCEKVEDFR